MTRPKPKAEFLSRLRMEEVVCVETGMPLKSRAGKQLYRSLAHLSFYSKNLGIIITVPVGFISDLDSVPRIPVVYLLFSSFGDSPAFLHDYVYSVGLFPRLDCDDLLLEAALATGVPAWKARCVYAGVRLGGASHYNQENNP